MLKILKQFLFVLTGKHRGPPLVENRFCTNIVLSETILGKELDHLCLEGTEQFLKNELFQYVKIMAQIAWSGISLAPVLANQRRAQVLDTLGETLYEAVILDE